MLDTLKQSENLHEHSHAQNRFAVIPTAEKLNADKNLCGRGVRIAFLDSGFYPHADFIDRVVEFYDASGEEKSLDSIFRPAVHHWHGTQTVASCAGSGNLSDGVYKGIASEAELVLVKVSENGGVKERNIERGLEWILDNHKCLKIRVLNISLGGDMDAAASESRINQLTEELVRQGVVITVAAGNSSESHSIPPASSPSVITVGGYSDANQFKAEYFELYHSNFGTTRDRLIKPEIIAPAMYVAAPILPETSLYQSAETLSLLAAAPDYAFPFLLDEYWERAELTENVIYLERQEARQSVESQLRERKIIAAHYQHVDGTSFAAPITASVAAQMLEANPNLTPAAVKNILLSTALKLSHQPRIRQGFGVLNARLAVEAARRETHFLDDKNFSPPRVENKKIVFFYHDDSARSVLLAGDFNNWNTASAESQFAECTDGVWRAEIDCQPKGEYRYKFLVDGKRWTEDPSHGLKEEDGFGGFNSILLVA